MSTRAEMSRERLLDAVAGLAPLVRAHAPRAEENRRQTDEVLQAMRAHGLLRLWTPREYGGAEVELPALMDAVTSLAEVDGAAGWMLGVLGAGGVVTAYLPPEGARDILGHGPDVAIAGTASPKGRAVPAPGGWLVTGQWPLVSGAHHADWLGGSALVFDGATPRMLPGGLPDIRLVFFPRNDCSVLDTWHATGLRASDSTDFAVDGVFVPERLSFSLFTAQPQVAGPLYRAGVMALFFTVLPAVFPGIARAAIGAFTDLAKAKTPTFSSTGLASRPTVHAQLARAQTLVASSSTYLWDVARRMTAALAAGQGLSDDLEAERRLACVNVAECCQQAVDLVHGLAGTSPLQAGDPLDRCFRDIHTVSQHLAVSPVWWEKTGQYYLGLGLGMP